jgi:hypothetical protein
MASLKTIANLFWDIRHGSLRAHKNSAEIITRTLNYGTLADWRWMGKRYGNRRILERIEMPRSGVRHEAKVLARLMFSDV